MLKGTFTETVTLFWMVIVMNQAQRQTVEQNHRAKKVQSKEIHFTNNMPITIWQDRFLANGKNKAWLIEALKVELEQAGIQVKIAAADADTMIVHTSIVLSHNKDVAVVGTDTDLPILLIQLCQPNTQIYFFKPGTEAHPNKVYDIKSST